MISSDKRTSLVYIYASADEKFYNKHLKLVTSDKGTRLLCINVSDNEKSFIRLTTRAKDMKPFLHTL